ncbi:hypothetical protein [Levilactobacillus brevis]|uniref:hypothetical protein n=1 Tax=Levilactobacillus brevis TaxID=1580 RepID=UPI002073A311|nr:hypothetical protein [Levilactobacillus brevis]
MKKNEILKMVQNLQNKALILGMDWETDQSPLFAEMHLSDFVSDVVDDTNEIMKKISDENF